MQKKFLTKDQALQKLKHYCGYQERSHYEVMQKMWDLRVTRSYHDELLSSLIEQDYLNEERFSIAFAGGKFRMNEWGRKKISYALKEKKVSEYNIRKALASIDEEEYKSALARLVSKKFEALRGEQYLVRKRKLIDYFIQRGFELPLINDALIALKDPGDPN